MYSPRVDPGGRQVQRRQGPRARGSPAHVVGGHDAQHLGGLDAYEVVGVLQQGFQALQAACGAEGPTNVLQAQTPAYPEVDGRADVGVKSTRALLFAGAGTPGGRPSASESLLGPLGARKAHPGDPVSTPPDFCACLLLVPPWSSPGFKKPLLFGETGGQIPACPQLLCTLERVTPWHASSST